MYVDTDLSVVLSELTSHSFLERRISHAVPQHSILCLPDEHILTRRIEDKYVTAIEGQKNKTFTHLNGWRNVLCLLPCNGERQVAILHKSFSRAHINVITEALEGENGSLSAYISEHDVGLDAQHSLAAECHGSRLRTSLPSP